MTEHQYAPDDREAAPGVWRQCPCCGGWFDTFHVCPAAGVSAKAMCDEPGFGLVAFSFLTGAVLAVCSIALELLNWHWW